MWVLVWLGYWNDNGISPQGGKLIFCIELVEEVEYDVGEVWREVFKHGICNFVPSRCCVFGIDECMFEFM